MKRLKSRNEGTGKQLVLHRETLRRLDAQELERAAGGATAWYTCDRTQRGDDDDTVQ